MDTADLRRNFLPASDTTLIEEDINIGLTTMSDLYSAFRRIADNPVLLETCIPGGNTLLVWDPVAVISVKDGTVELKSNPEMNLPPPPTEMKVPRYLQEIIEEYKITNGDNSSGQHPFIGGFVGFVGYEWMARQEISSRQTEHGVPDIWFGLYDRAVIRNGNNQTKLIAVPRINGISLESARIQLKEALSGIGKFDGNARMIGTAKLSHDFPKEEFVKGVKEVKRAIRSGEVYQADIAQRVRTARMDPEQLYRRLTRLNPSPFSGILSADEFTIVSASPERLLNVWSESRGRRYVSTRPIAGTRPRASGSLDARMERSLRRSPKEIAEHTMLVDLSRNDIGRVAHPGTVEVSELYTVERYSHVMHLVSEVRGLVAESRGLPELFQALFPGGSITGTPKIRSTEIIGDIEPVPRGAYTGSMGYISLDGSMDFNILIRSAFFPGQGKEMQMYAGSGIVQDSNPDREWEETRSKLAALIEAVSGPDGGGFPWSPPHIASSWKPEPVKHQYNEARVLLIDNYDSFTYNLVQYLETLGADVMVFRNDSSTIPELKRTRPTHMIISPGPGIPGKAGVTPEAVRAFDHIPVLGVCLGHQAIVEAYGGTLKKARLPMHGKTSRIIRMNETGGMDIFDGMPGDLVVGRYHSLIADELPSELAVTAQTVNGEVMAIRHRSIPTFGVQFHPESILTPNGVQILSNFLSMKRSR